MVGCYHPFVPKESRLTFRVSLKLKQELERVAQREARSVAQICEAFLRAGLSAYQKEGSRYVHNALGSSGHSKNS
jgi:hypothetical protein